MPKKKKPSRVHAPWPLERHTETQKKSVTAKYDHTTFALPQPH